jgi:nucleoside-diphosphate-sugar epimerase
MTVFLSKKNQSWSFENDLAFILDLTKDVFINLNKAHIFISGGSGFIGKWLLESLNYANSNLKLNIKATVLTRSIKKFKLNSPDFFSQSQLNFIEGDVINFKYDDINYTHIIHAATDASAFLNENNPKLMFETIVDGTKHMLNFAVKKKIKKFLYLSSGAVYGQQPFDVERIKEDFQGAPDCNQPRNAYAEGKRAAEMLCAIYNKQFGLDIAIARIFALLGPHISLDIHFAAGNFIKDAMRGKKIEIKGDGKPYRSYLYVADLIIWLWHMLQRAKSNQPYNVGSDESISIEDLASRISIILGNVGYKILGNKDFGWNLGRYVPDTSLIKNELNLEKKVSLEDAILRTAIWSGWKSK